MKSRKERLFGWIVACTLLLAAFVSAEELKMGIIPLEAPKIMFKQFTPLADYLSKELGVTVTLVIGKDYQATMDAIGNNEVQFAYLTPTTYPKSEKQNPDAKITPLVRFQEGGKGSYRSCIIVPADSSVTEVSQLKGKTFAFGNEDSTASHLMPRSMIIAAGLDIKTDLAKYEYLGSHTNVANAVKPKTFEAGGVKDSVADQFVKEGSVKIIATSEEIPEFPICVNNKMSDDMVKKLKEALLKLKADDEASKEILTSINKKYTGCEETKSEHYDVIREMIKKLYGDDFYKKN